MQMTNYHKELAERVLVWHHPVTAIDEIYGDDLPLRTTLVGLAEEEQLMSAFQLLPYLTEEEEVDFYNWALDQPIDLLTKINEDENS